MAETYKTDLHPLSMPDIDAYSAEKIIRELIRIQNDIADLSKRIDAIKIKRSFFIPGHSGNALDIINTNNKVIPVSFGTAGMFLERFSNINRACFEGQGTITRLKLYSAVRMSSLANGQIVNFKTALQIDQANVVRFGPTHTIDGTPATTDSTVVQTFMDCVDISELIPEFVSGDFFLGIAAWVTGGPASDRVLIGGGQAANPNPYTALIVETEDD